MSIRSVFFILFGLGYCFVTKAETETLSVGIGVGTPSLQTVLESDKSNNAKELVYSPNQAGNTLLAFQYGNIGFGIGLRNSLNEKDSLAPIESTYQDYQFRIFGKKRSYEISYQSYKSYVIENPDEFDSNLTPASSEALFPDMKSTNLMLSFVHNFSPEKLSKEAAFGMGEVQKKSGGSWLAGAFVSRQETESDKSLTPSFTGSFYSEIQDIHYLRQLNLGVSGGYSYLYYKKGFFASALLMSSIAYQKQRIMFLGESEKEDSEVTANRNFLNLGFGYNVDFHKVALNVYTSSINTRIRSAGLRTTSTDVNLIYTYRMQNKKIPILSRVSAWFD
jgi:hypothetical protein